MHKITRSVIALGAVAAVIIGTACTAQAAAPKAAAAVTATPATFVAYGDSNMERPDSWLNQFSSDSFTKVGGYYKSGYTSAQVLAGMTTPVTADLAVIGLGTNDVKIGVTTAEVCSNIKKIAGKAAAAHTLVLAIPPNDYTDDATTHIDRRTKGIILNRDVSICAMSAGYLFADPWAFQRAWTGGWGGGADVDSTHPTTLVAGQVADRMPIYMSQALVGSVR